jgi:hypothetical protein
MAVYSYRMIELLSTSLNTMASTMFSKTPLILGGGEFLEAFVDPNHVPMLKQVEEICSPPNTTWAHTSLQTEDGESLDMQVQFIGKAPVILPQYIRHGLQPTCPQHLKDKINAWVTERVNFGRAFGDAQDAIVYLNESCGDVEAMSLMLPCLPAIMAGISNDGDSKVVKRAQKLTTLKRVGKLPRLPRQVTQRLAEASALVSIVTLTQDAPMPAVVRYDAHFTVKNMVNSRRVNIFHHESPMQAAPVASFI